MKTLGIAIIAILVIRSNGYGQTFIGAAYDEPSGVRVAPGQIVPLFVTGLKTVLAGGMVKAQTVPLPTVLAGISVTLSQTPQYSRPLPLVSINQFNHCAGSSSTTPDCLLTAITAQIPFDIAVLNPLIGSPALQPVTTLAISENGTMSQSFAVIPVPDQIHVLQSCDIGGETRNTGVCFPIVTHLDGSLVLQAPRVPGQPPLSNSEALPGEALIMYAYGLGQVSPAMQAGSASPNPPAVVVSPVYLQFDYRPNASPSAPTLNSSLTTTAQPLFAGLAPDEVGLYQINFVVPSPPPGTPVCGAPVESNLAKHI
jgi:uncharacterized protein (TIGR03437 family)